MAALTACGTTTSTDPEARFETEHAEDVAGAELIEHGDDGAHLDAPESAELEASQVTPETAAVQRHDLERDEAGPRPQLTRDELVAANRRWIGELVAASPARMTVSERVEWRFERDSTSRTGAFLVARVTADDICGAPRTSTVRVPYHSELGELQPSPGLPLLIFGSYEDDVLTAEWVAPYDGESLAAHRAPIPLRHAELFDACEEVKR